jgi:hypothetical protein
MDTPNNRLLGEVFSSDGLAAKLRISNDAFFLPHNNTQIDFTVGSPSSKESSIMTTATAAVVLGLTLYFAARHPGTRRLLEQSGVAFDRMEPALAGAESGWADVGRGESRNAGFLDRIFGHSEPNRLSTRIDGGPLIDSVSMMVGNVGGGGGAAFDAAVAKASLEKAKRLDKEEIFGLLGGKDRTTSFQEMAEQSKIRDLAALVDKDLVVDNIRVSLKPLLQAEKDAGQELTAARDRLQTLNKERRAAQKAGGAITRDFVGEERAIQDEITAARQRQEQALTSIHEKMQAVERRSKEIEANPSVVQDKTVLPPDPLTAATNALDATRKELIAVTKPGMLHHISGELSERLRKMERVETAGGRLPTEVVDVRTRLEAVRIAKSKSQPFDLMAAATKLQDYVAATEQLRILNPVTASQTVAQAIQDVDKIAPAFNIIEPKVLSGITARIIAEGTDDANLRGLGQIQLFADRLVKRLT